MLKFLTAVRLISKYGPIITEIVKEVIENLKVKEQSGVRGAVTADQMKANVSQAAASIADVCWAVESQE